MRAPGETYSSSVIDEPRPASLLDEDLVAAADELVDADGGDPDAELVVLDLGGDSDLHGLTTPLPVGAGTSSSRMTASCWIAVEV